MDGFRFRYVDLLVEPHGFQYFEPINEALYFGVERFPQCDSWRADIARYLGFADRYIDRAITRGARIGERDYSRDYQVCRLFLRATRDDWRGIQSYLASAKLPAEHRAELRGDYLRAAVTLRQCERCIAAAQAGDVVAVGFLVHDTEAMWENEQWESDTAYDAHEVSERAKRSANASHAKHRDNKRAARDWYAAHKPITKDDAAQRMHDSRIVAASLRTIRGYLTGQ